ncbi:MAG: ribonuclease [Solobacterium sp.]|nr:ribonuclease [Solobacterium sp.]
MEKAVRKLLVCLFVFLFVSGCTAPAPAPVISPIPAATVSPYPTPSPSPTLAPISAPSPSAAGTPEPSASPEVIPEETRCDDKACVALYIHTWKHLPSNYMTKKKARKIGWQSGPLWKVKEGMALGGDVHGDYQDALPDGYDWYECDINTIGKKKRGTERLVYSKKGELVYYTEDHYETFELLYGEE